MYDPGNQYTFSNATIVFDTKPELDCRVTEINDDSSPDVHIGEIMAAFDLLVHHALRS